MEAVQRIRSKGDIAVVGYEARRVSSADMRFMQFSRKQMIFGTSLIVLIGGVACWRPVNRAMNVDPAIVLRDE